MKKLKEHMRAQFGNKEVVKKFYNLIQENASIEGMKAYVKEFYAFWGDCPEGLKLLIDALETQKRPLEG